MRHSETFPPKGNLRERLLNDPFLLNHIKHATIIFGMDELDPDHGALFYGKTAMDDVLRFGPRGAGLVIWVPIDFGTDDVHYLAGACLIYRGACSYGCGPGEPDVVNPSFNGARSE